MVLIHRLIVYVCLIRRSKYHTCTYNCTVDTYSLDSVHIMVICNGIQQEVYTSDSHMVRSIHYLVNAVIQNTQQHLMKEGEQFA